MKIPTAVALLAAVASLSALAQNSPEQTKPQQICIRPFDTPTGNIDHTKIVDPQTILFYMRDGKIWKNTLRGPCRGLEFHGFSFVTHYDELCSNAVAIQVIDTGQVCQLGYFTPYTPPATPAH
ncbi:MAG TPA: hypothetical protein VMU22_00625 [Rhizomicrobium sp.]|nr:hypothetical protein [Rhizomicrobium sp.]